MQLNGSEHHRDIIWAYGRTRPQSPLADTHLHMHYRMGRTQLRLGHEVSTPETLPEILDDAAEVPSPSEGLPLLSYQKTIVVHALFCFAGFLVLLPIGSLIARFLRAAYPTWIMAHWIVQFVVGA